MNTAAIPVNATSFVYCYNDYNIDGEIKVHVKDTWEGTVYSYKRLDKLGSALGAYGVHVWRYEYKKNWYIDFITRDAKCLHRIVLPEEVVTKIVVGNEVVYIHHDDYIEKPLGAKLHAKGHECTCGKCM